MTSAGRSADSARALDLLLARVGPRFARSEPRRRAQLFVRGVLSGLARKNGWTLAQYAGDSDPNGMQRLLTTARWDVDGVRDDLRGWLAERIGDPEHGVFVPIEAGFPKKGTRSIGVHRQYRESVGRTENVQLGVFLGYVTSKSWALIDRELFLPESWTSDPQRCRQLGVPETVGFVPRAQLARRMIERALRSRVPATWIAADESFAEDPAFGAWLAQSGMPYLLAAQPRERIATLEGSIAELRNLVTRLPTSAWLPIAPVGAGQPAPDADPPEAGDLTSGSRPVGGGRPGAGAAGGGDLAGGGGLALGDVLVGGGELARIALPADPHPGWERMLLVLRPAADQGPVRYFRCRARAGTPDRELIRVARVGAGIRGYVQQARREMGLDQYQVRRYDAWYRYVTLCLLAGAYLAITRGQTPLAG
jgi:SRSO17 transposase